MATWIRLGKFKDEPPEKAVKASPQQGAAFSDLEIITLLGGDVLPIKLLSDDLLLVREEHGPSDGFLKNNLASILANRPIYGDAILVDPKEYVHDASNRCDVSCV